MFRDALFIDQLIGGDLFRFDVGSINWIPELEEIGSAEGGAIDEFQRGFIERIINQRRAWVESRVVVAVLIVAEPGIHVQVGEDRKVAFEINTIILPIGFDHITDQRAGLSVPESLLLLKVVPVFSTKRQRQAVPEVFDE